MESCLKNSIYFILAYNSHTSSILKFTEKSCAKISILSKTIAKNKKKDYKS